MNDDALDVDLVYEANRLLTGTLACESVALLLSLPVSSGAAGGRYGDAPMLATWDIASNYKATEQPASLRAAIGDDDIELSTTFMLRSPDVPVLVGATLVGFVGPDVVSIDVSRGEGTQSIVLDGSIGATEIALVAIIDRPIASVEGSVAARPVRLNVTRSDDHRSARLEGQWFGTPAICLLTAAALLYFV